MKVGPAVVGVFELEVVVGLKVGSSVGVKVGSSVGLKVGSSVGPKVGCAVGLTVGCAVGLGVLTTANGAFVGAGVIGEILGASVA